MRVLPLLLGSCVALAPMIASAQGSDPAAARAQLQQGYALKQQGKCDEALPHFTESIRLDRQPKSLLNLADCEEKLGKLGSAQTHFVEARDLARVQGVEPMKALAEQHLQAIEKRIPKLTVRLAKDAPPDTVVTRDGTELGAVSLGTPLPIDPGSHTIVARGGGLQHRYVVTLAEAQTNELEVTPVGGEASSSAVASGSHDAPSNAKSPEPPGKDSGAQSETSSPSGSRGAAYVLGGVGVVGIAVGAVAGLTALSKSKAADESCAPDHCTSAQYPAFQSTREDAVQARTLSIIGFGAGGVALASAAILWFTSSKQSTTGSGIRVAPIVAVGGAGAALGGTW